MTNSSAENHVHTQAHHIYIFSTQSYHGPSHPPIHTTLLPFSEKSTSLANFMHMHILAIQLPHEFVNFYTRNTSTLYLFLDIKTEIMKMNNATVISSNQTFSRRSHLLCPAYNNINVISYQFTLAD